MIQVTSYNPITPIQPIPSVKGNSQDAYSPIKEKKDTVEFSKESLKASESLSAKNQSKVTKEEQTQTKAEIEQIIKKSDEVATTQRQNTATHQTPQDNQNTGNILNLVG